jgi:hypothetical protein
MCFFFWSFVKGSEGGELNPAFPAFLPLLEWGDFCKGKA